MIPSLWVGKTGLDAQQTRMTVVSNNMANVATTGFKRSRANFEDLVYQNFRQAGALSAQDSRYPTGLYLGTGVRAVSTERNYTQGNLVRTEGALDLAINGRGFFEILLPNGNSGYTRDGSFQINENGEMVTSQGYLLQPSITIPDNTTSVTIGNDGSVTVTTQDETVGTEIGTITTVDFLNPQGLQPMGQNMFAETIASGAPQIGTPTEDGFGRLEQHYLEASNVNVVAELVDMIETQRAYEMNSKSIQTSDEMLGYITRNL